MPLTARNLSPVVKPRGSYGRNPGPKSHVVWLSSPAWRSYLFFEIDLDVRGIVPDCFFEAVGLVAGLSAEFKMDLVEIESSSPGMERSIQIDGRFRICAADRTTSSINISDAPR
jgi:hypothetical protein